ncbi:MAG: MerR family transcriptional regulator [Anaerolineaceae bacterium]|nr:MerR family transcriptional regulator [Anaerolineaceae bacterium]
MTSDLTLEDLAKQSGLSIRTLRFYIQEGLLPGPDTRGKYASYSRQHIEQLELIQRLKARYLPLQHIRQLLENMSPADINKMLQLQESVSPSNEEKIIEKLDDPQSAIAGARALDYIKSLEQSHEIIQEMQPSYSPQPVRKNQKTKRNTTSVESKKKIVQATREESWHRIKLTKGVELHIRSSREKENKEEINTLIEFARNLFPNKK